MHLLKNKAKMGRGAKTYSLALLTDLHILYINIFYQKFQIRGGSHTPQKIY